MLEAIDLVHCTVYQVYILPEDLEHSIYLRIPMYYWRVGAS